MSVNQENLTESDKEKMKSFLNTLYKQIPTFSGNPGELDNFLECVEKVESPALAKTLFAMVKTKLQGPAADAIKDKDFEGLNELKVFLVTTFKIPAKGKKAAKSPQASTSKILEGGVNIQQNVIDSTQERLNLKLNLKTEKSPKGVEKSPKAEEVKEDSSKKDIKNVPKAERKDELHKLLKHKKLMQLIEEERRKNLMDASTQTDQEEVVPKSSMTDQKCQTVRSCTKIIKNYITVNITNANGDMSAENLKTEIVEKLDKSILQGTQGTKRPSPRKNRRPGKNARKAETKSRTEEQVAVNTDESAIGNDAEDESPPDPETETETKPKDLVPKPEDVPPSTESGKEKVFEEKESEPKEDEKPTEEVSEEPKPKEDENPTEEISEEPEPKEDKNPTKSRINERPNNITLTGSRKRSSRESAREEPEKRFRFDRSPRKPKRFENGPRRECLFCFYCKKRGHSQEDCRRKIKDNKYCGYCDMRGHSEAECTKKALRNLGSNSLSNNFPNNNNNNNNNWNFSADSFGNCYNQAVLELFKFGQSNNPRR